MQIDMELIITILGTVAGYLIGVGLIRLAIKKSIKDEINSKRLNYDD